MQPTPFKIEIPQERLDALQRRLREIQWPGDCGNADWQYGVEESWLRRAVEYWREEYDWRHVETEINKFPHYRVEIDKVPIHFIHVRSSRANAIPLILTHGWPWTFWDWRDVISELAEPLDSDLPAFDVVVASLPGFAFSSPLRTAGIGVREVGRLWQQLMTDVLGYQRFAAAGGDWGSLVSAELGHAFPDAVIGVHLTLPLMPGVDLASLSHAPFAPDERWMADRNAEASTLIASHMAVHCNDPQTLAYALADSPVGLAAWLWERRLAWSDADYDGPARSLEFLCTLASIYWLTNTIGSSLRIYRDHFSKPWTSLNGRERLIDVPTGYAIGPKELVMFPKAMAETLCNLRRWTILPRGGHFAAAEVPELVIEEYRAFFGGLA